jgi:hypothetical protein
MAKRFYYQRAVTMAPRPGVEFSTTYYKQTLEERQRMTRFIRECLVEMAEYLEQHPADYDWATTTPLKGFKKTQGQKNRTMWEIMEDIAGEAQGRQKNGLPKDYAMAPIERWNKLFRDTDYEFEIVEGTELGDRVTSLFEIEDVRS